MVESILDMKREVMNSLKRIGIRSTSTFDYTVMRLNCTLIELNFLKPSQSFTQLVSIAFATIGLSVVPLVIR